MYLVLSVILCFKNSSGCSITLIHLERRRSFLNIHVCVIFGKTHVFVICMYVLCGSALLISSPATYSYKET